MSNTEFYMVYIDRAATASYEAVKEKMNLSVSWYRINEKLWILYTTSDAEKLYKRLFPLVKDDGSIFICKLDIHNRQGWMTQRFWDWLKDKTA